MLLKAKRHILDSIFGRKIESDRWATIGSTIINILGRVAGYAKYISIAVIIGFGAYTDTFFMALSLLGLLIIFADVFDSIGVPNLVRLKAQNEKEFKEFAGFLFTFTMTIAVLGILIFLIFMPLILKIPVGFDKRYIHLTKISILIMLPYVFFQFIFHHIGAVLRSVRRFMPFFFGLFLFSFLSFLFTTIGLIIFKSYIVLPISVSLAQILSTIYIMYVGREFLYFRLMWDDKIKHFIKQFFYLSIIYGANIIYTIIYRAFASAIGDKGVSALTYGIMIVSAIKSLVKLEQIAIVSFSEVNIDLKTLNKYILKLFAMSIPISILIFLSSDVIIKIMFGYGKFSNADINLTSTALRYFVLVLPFYFINPILNRIFQIKNSYKTIFILTISSLIINSILNYIFVMKMHYGIIGICIGTFIANLGWFSVGYMITRGVVGKMIDRGDM